MARFVEKALPGRVLPFVFTQKSKSDLGWRFLAMVETGRFKICASTPATRTGTADLLRELKHCQAQVLDGPGRMLRWGVTDGTRDAETGAVVHDDLVLSAALCGVLEEQAWGIAASEVAVGEDVFDGMREVY